MNINLRSYFHFLVIIRDLPGADKCAIGNYMKMFGELRVNYDEQNWMMLINQLLFDYKVRYI